MDEGPSPKSRSTPSPILSTTDVKSFKAEIGSTSYDRDEGGLACGRWGVPPNAKRGEEAALWPSEASVGPATEGG